MSEVQGLSGSTAETFLAAIKQGCGAKNTVVLDAENDVIPTAYVPERRIVHLLGFEATEQLEGNRREMVFRDNGRFSYSLLPFPRNEMLI